MNPTKFLYRAPLLDCTQHVMGYRLGWQNNEKSSALTDRASLGQLLNLVAQCPEKAESGLFFLDAGTAGLPAEVLPGLKPESTVLMFDQADLLSAGSIPLAMSLYAQGFGLALCNVDLALLESNNGLLSLMTHIEVDSCHPDLTQIVNFARLAEPALGVVVGGVPDWPTFDACASRGLMGFFGTICTAPNRLRQSAQLGAQAVLVLQLMQMVRDNADVRDMEKVLKRDATLSFKLLRHINSASFGMEVEIESLSHAVMMLGYSPFYRWLSVLLAMTSSQGFSPALLQAAIVRGRFVELLGRQLLSRNEAENLFVVGFFSLLEPLLGVPMAQLLRQISLPTTIVQALLSREGVYGPLLALAEACEQENGCASELADALFMTPAQVNKAHWSALVWTQNLKI
jgi:EAL and modified HD-GYP domain-containing signal transduction protein